MQGGTIVYIFNIIEDIIDAFQTLEKEDRATIMQQNSLYIDQIQVLSVISKYPNRLKYYFVFLHEVDEEYVQYVCQLHDVKRDRIQILVPKKIKQTNKESISLRLLHDQQILAKIKSIPKFQLLSFCMSEEYLKLYDVLKDQAQPIELTPRQRWNKIQRFATKPGIRQLIQNLGNPKLFMAKGKIFYKSENFYDDVVNYIANRIKTQSLVVKTEKLFAGRGVVIIKSEQVQGLPQNQLDPFIRKKLSKPFWKEFDIVVQEYIDLDLNTGSPMVEININKEGVVSIVWICAMSVSDEQYYVEGIQCGKQLFTKETYDKMVYIGETLGKVYSELGYWGNINIDLLFDKKGLIYVGESNVRRSWTIFASNFAQSMHGKDFNHNVFVRTGFLYAQKKIGKIETTKQLLKELNDLGWLYNKNKKSGIIITSGVNCLRSDMIFYIIIGNKKQQVDVISKKFKQKYTL